MGYTNNVSFLCVFLSWFIFALSIFFIMKSEKDSNKGSDLIILMLFFLSFVPFTTCVQFGLFTFDYICFAGLFWLLLFSFNSISVKISFPKWKLSGTHYENKIIVFLAVVSFLVTMYVSGKYAGFRLHFNLLDVYSLREEAREYNMPTILNYLYSWTTALNPFFLIYCLKRNKIIPAGIFAICTLMNFGFNGSKTSFFLPIFFLLVSFICTRIGEENISSRKLIAYGFFALLFVALFEFYILDSYFISSFFVRRMMFVENQNSYFYFDFFKNNVPDYFRGSFLRLFGFSTPYPNLARDFIGTLYHHPQTNANCGLIADAITNFGPSGFLLFPFLLNVFFRIYNKCVEKVDSSLILCASIYISTNLVNTFFMTSLITHGIALLLFLIFLISKSKRNA